jgi:hypothetical protein
MEILKYFERENKDDIRVYRLKGEELDDLLKELPENFRLSYISDEELESLSIKNEMTKSEFLEEYLLPDKGNIKSGDFGEIFSFHTVIENYRNKKIDLIGPLKWSWKDRNKPAQYADAVLFHISKDPKYSKDDLLITIESKMKATKSKRHRIQEAINGANNDRLTRLSKTLNWLEEKYARLGDIDNKKLAIRFGNPSEHGTYKKEHKAIAILDKAFEREELDKPLNQNQDIIVIVFLFDDLKGAYETTRQNIIESVRENE